MEPVRAPDMLWNMTYNIKSDDVVLVLVINQAMALIKRCVLVVNLLSHISLSSTASSTGYNQKPILVFDSSTSFQQSKLGVCDSRIFSLQD